MTARRFRRQWLTVAALCGAVLMPMPSQGAGPAATPLVPAGYQALIGPLHEHSGYSDGYPGSTPGSYYASAAGFGNDFLLSGEHSDNLDVPVVASEYCVGPDAPTCLGGDPDPVKSLTKWDAMAAYAAEATTPAFTGVRGFEWTSDRFGHINVYFSANKTNAKADGGYATMETFYRWLTTGADLQGGGDGLAVFNHPGAKKLQVVGDSDPALNWDDFAYRPEADAQMVGLELYNDDQTFGDGKGPVEGYYAHVLDKGWHVGAVGAEDLGHSRTDDWGGPTWAKTVILSTDRSPAALKAAMQARRFYAVRFPDTRLGFTVDNALMGSRLGRPSGSTLHVAATAVRAGRSGLTLEVVTSGGIVVASGTDDLVTDVTTSAAQKYYFLRVRDGATVVGYSSPVWVTSGATMHAGEWLAGDLHVHSCYSHDSWCPTGDDNTAPEEFYTFGGTPDERFHEASLRGLDYLALTDHHSDGSPQDTGTDSMSDPGWGTHGVIGVHGYENSIGGHAQMLGASRVYPGGSHNVADTIAMADALRADGGVFQANHPADDVTRRLTSCDDLTGMHWSYGLQVPVDTVEVWNISHVVQPPIPSGTSNSDAIFYWECWLNRGAHVAPTGGSDSHWLTLTAVQGVGNPTTWVFAADRSERGVLDGIKAGRTSISLTPPAMGGAMLVLEADVNRDGVYESMVGDTVPPGTKMQVRALGLPGAGLVRIRANNVNHLDGALIAAGGAVKFQAPYEPGWVRAELYVEDGRDVRRKTCDPVVGTQTTYCRNRVALTALTAAIYLG